MFRLRYCDNILVVLLVIGSALSDDCKDAESAILCHGSRVVKNIVKSMHKDINSPLTIVPGLEIVSVPIEPTKIDQFDVRSNSIGDDDSIIGRVGKYLQSHELKIKFSDLLEKAEFKEALISALNGIDDGKEVVEGRKKDKSGLGMVMMMGLMMGKMMAALGLGGVGALALKALGVSMMALMLAAIIGIKKLAEGGKGGGDGHHRKRREIEEDIPLPYRGWAHMAVN